jgi:hypothetical protein
MMTVDAGHREPVPNIRLRFKDQLLCLLFFPTILLIEVQGFHDRTLKCTPGAMQHAPLKW